MLGLIVVGMFGAIFGEDNSDTTEEQISLITKSPEEMLPSDTEIDTKWKIVNRKERSIEATGFDSGAELEIDRLDGYSLSTGYVKVYKFDSVSNANSYYGSEVDFTKEERGYTEISSPVSNAECFAVKSGDYLEGYYRWAICKKLNIVFISEVDSFSNWRTGYYDDLAEITAKRIN